MSVKTIIVQWAPKSLRELAIINYGRDPSEILDVDGQYPVYGTSGSERLGKDYLHDGDSIVLGRKGTIERVHFAKGRFWTIDTAYFLSDFRDTYPMWLFYFLTSVDLRNLNEATGVPSLSRDLLYKIQVPTPPKREQAKIAEVLSTVDQAIQQTEALIAKQQRIKTGLMQDLLTRGIDENGNLRSEETHQFKDSPLGRIPVEWEVKTLDNCVQPHAPICYGILMPGQGHDDGIPVIKVKDIIGGRIVQNDILLTDPKIDAQYKRSRLRAGDLLLTIRGTTGRVAMVPWELDGSNITQDTARVRLREELSNQFFYFLLQTFPLQDQIQLHTLGQAVKGINIGEVKRLFFGLPDEGEQQEIANHLGAIEQAIDSSKSDLVKLHALKTALMQDLLTGKVRVTPLLTEQEETGA